MRAVSLVLVLACAAAVAFAAEAEVAAVADVEADAEGEVDVETFTDAESEAELAVPTLPALDSGCLPTYSKRNYRSRKWKKHVPRVVSFGGKCVLESACAPADSEPGYCAGIGVTCCKSTPAAAPAAPAASAPAVPASTSPVLKSGTTPCATQGGSCISSASCKGTTKSGLCPGLPNDVKCCFASSTPTPTPTPSAQSLTTLVAIPAGINAGLSIAGSSFLTASLGRPGCPLTTKCFDCSCALQNAVISRNVVTLQITPNFKLSGLSPYVNAVKRAFDAIKAAGASNPLLLRVYNEAKTAGGLCCRPVKKSNGSAGSGWSNHSWGCAADFYFGSSIDPRGDGKTQYGLLLMAPYFAAEKLYWAAGYKGSEEDAMHFEASQQALNSWKSLLK